MTGKRGNPNPSPITRFPKGVSGNPGGKPKGLSITRLVREELQKPSAPTAKTTNADLVAKMVVSLAKAGHPVFTPLVWRYVDGDPKENAEKAIRELAAKLAPKLGLDADALADEFLRDIGAA